MSQVLLQVSDLVRHFAGVRAVDGVSLEIDAGQCVALWANALARVCMWCVVVDEEICSFTKCL
jgi:hypothetical protein